jgi:hypothetical protein
VATAIVKIEKTDDRNIMGRRIKITYKPAGSTDVIAAQYTLDLIDGYREEPNREEYVLRRLVANMEREWSKPLREALGLS